VSALERLEVGGVVCDHLDTLRSHGTEKRLVGDVILFVVIPAGVTTLLLISKHPAKSVSGVLITAVAILTGLLFNLLILIFDSATRAGPRGEMSEQEERAHELLRQTHANVAFAVLVGILTAVAATASAIAGPEGFWQYAASGVAYFLAVELLMTMLMILNRVRALVDEELRSRKSNPAG
jgi:hypothetical protein